jgi:hypothetical protein
MAESSFRLTAFRGSRGNNPDIYETVIFLVLAIEDRNLCKLRVQCLHEDHLARKFNISNIAYLHVQQQRAGSPRRERRAARAGVQG